MDRRNIKKSSLRRLRDAENGGRGVGAREIACRVADILEEESRSAASIIAVEHRGTSDYYLIEALAQVYGRSRDEIAEMTNPRLVHNKM